MTDQYWELQGTLAQPIYSPRGTVEGLMLDVDGIAVQFVIGKHEAHLAHLALHLKQGQKLTLIGALRKPSPKGEAEHEVYDLIEIVGRGDDSQSAEYTASEKEIGGKIVRFNYARHGEPNGVVLDTGDFIHTRPDGLRKLAWKLGDQVHAKGRVQPLASGMGVVLEYPVK
ncbi:hypothetical protein [Diaphorobacter aerolatus]|nr:hypothetical protein [Diaphorobacter aerolatus]